MGWYSQGGSGPQEATGALEGGERSSDRSKGSSRNSPATIPEPWCWEWFTETLKMAFVPVQKLTEYICIFILYEFDMFVQPTV